MTGARAHEVLYESEAALRLVDHELTTMHDVLDLGDATGQAVPTDAQSELDQVLEQANALVLSAVAHLRESRSALHSDTAALSDTHEIIGTRRLLDDMETRLLDVAALLDDHTPDGRQAHPVDIFTALRSPSA